jgi:hypothetical protein
MQVSWYSPYLWEMFPGVQVDPHARRELQEAQEMFEELQKEERRAKREALKQAEANGTANPEDAEPRKKIRVPIPWYVRGQSPDMLVGQLDMGPQGWQNSADPQAPTSDRLMWRSRPNMPVQRVSETEAVTTAAAPVEAVHPAVQPLAPQAAPLPPTNLAENPLQGLPEPPAPEAAPVPDSSAAPVEPKVEAPTEILPSDPQQGLAEPVLPPPVSGVPDVLVEPIMSYTRMFDGSDADLVAALRDYVELSGDRRSGGWEAYLHRSEDFIRFTAHRMILEMLMLHGGEGRRRFVIKHRNVE